QAFNTNNGNENSATIYAQQSGTGYCFYAETNGTTKYGPFTGGHDILISEETAFDIKPGLLLSVTGEARQRQIESANRDISTILSKVKLADTRNDKRLIGVFVSGFNPSNHWHSPQQGEQLAIVNSIGTGLAWVSNINGEVNAGDYITS